MSKNILILKGSPREKGNSAELAQRVFAGAEEAGATVEDVYLHGLDVRPCDHCDFCQEDDDVGCVVEDDMQAIYPKLEKSDVIVFATPIYWFTVTAQLKACIDRFYALQSSTGNALKGKKIAVVLVYGDTDLWTSGGINAIHTFESISRYIGLEIVDVVHTTTNDIGDIDGQTEVLKRAYKLGQTLAA